VPTPVKTEETRWAADGGTRDGLATTGKKWILGVIRDQISPNSTPKPCFGTMLLTFGITKYKPSRDGVIHIYREPPGYI
jgi:hypothetical protein